MTKSAQYWIDNLNLAKHPEGGWFKEIYRSSEIIKRQNLPNRFNGDRSFSTSIYFLLPYDEICAFHILKQDELWYFHYGFGLIIHVIDEDGEYFKLHLGNDLEKKQLPQIVIKKGWLFAAEVNNKSGCALVGCNVAPGFDFEDFQMSAQKQILEKYPQHSLIINQFSK